MPTCPACRQRLGWKQSFSFWNPWDYPCPHCRASLEASSLQKWMVVAVVPVGLVLALVPIVMEQLGRWQTRDSLAYFALVVPSLILAAMATWPRTTFKLKSKP